MLLERLIEAKGVSGNEHEVRSLILREIKKYVKKVKIDKFGNIIASKEGKGSRVMLVAHMDEVGLMIKSINDKGGILCSSIGGVKPISLIGQKIGINTKKGRFMVLLVLL
ncbi:hypothetical protein CL618_02895 [archaeon]|nr:hypothetical protein [archaeon]|tara:strand:+ start:2622 stop:2951 length:330 start_codon:yes stop_codon:yes gene_type:complete